MILHFFLILLLITLISWFLIKEKYNPITLFVGFWTFIFGLAYYDSFNIIRASSRSYSIIFTGVVFFVLGCLFVQFLSKKKVNKTKTNYAYIVHGGFDDKHLRIIRIYSIIILLLMSMYAVRSIGFFMAGMDLTSLRQNFNELVIQNSIERLLWMLFVTPSSFAIMSIDLYIYFTKKKKEYLYFSLLNTIFLSLTNGGRIILLFFLVQFVFFFYLSNSQSNGSLKRGIRPYLKVVFVGAIVFYVMYFVSEGREMAASYSESVNVYFSGCFPFFDYQIDNFDKSDIRMYGFSFFYAPITIIEMILSNFLGIEYSSELIAARNIIYSLQESIDIGSTSRFNAFATTFFYFYMDGGVPGVCIESAVYGMICFFIFNKVRYNKSPLFCMFYALIINTIISSMVRWPLADVSVTMAFLYIFLVARKGRYAKRI